MNFSSYVTYLLVIGAIGICAISPVHAFMGDYISAAQGDMAVMATVKNSDIDYDSEDTDAGDIDRQVFAVGLSRSVSPEAKVFGSLNYAFDGELGGGDASLDGGYSISAGGSYTFWNQRQYSIQGYGQVNYIFEETFEYSERNTDFTFDGYEVIFGIQGRYKLTPQFYLYGALVLVPLSDFTMEVSGDLSDDTWDLDRERTLGVTGGVLYDLYSWFVKAEVSVGTEGAFGATVGMKF